MPTDRKLQLFKFCAAVILGFVCAAHAQAQGGPPLITNDPGTPGNANWEINLGVMPVLTEAVKSVQAIQIDLNYGLGDRIQLTYEVPFVWQSAAGQQNETGWSNGFPGVKWRFVDGGENGLNVSTFPQLELSGSPASVRDGLAENGTRFLLPFEASKKVGPLELDFEAGYYFPFNTARSRYERIVGLAWGHKFTEKLEAIGEVYDDKVMSAPEHNTTFDVGARYQVHKGLIFLVMAGRSFLGNSSGQPEFFAYTGIQILLEHYGSRLHSEP